MWPDAPQDVLVTLDFEREAIAARYASLEDALLAPFAFHLFDPKTWVTRITKQKFELFISTALKILRETPIVPFESVSSEELHGLFL
jgi:hypothetical protein